MRTNGVVQPRSQRCFRERRCRLTAKSGAETAASRQLRSPTRSSCLRWASVRCSPMPAHSWSRCIPVPSSWRPPPAERLPAPLSQSTPSWSRASPLPPRPVASPLRSVPPPATARRLANSSALRWQEKAYAMSSSSRTACASTGRRWRPACRAPWARRSR